jgi:hypothetical protein
LRRQCFQLAIKASTLINGNRALATGDWTMRSRLTDLELIARDAAHLVYSDEPYRIRLKQYNSLEKRFQEKAPLLALLRD